MVKILLAFQFYAQTVDVKGQIARGILQYKFECASIQKFRLSYLLSALCQSGNPCSLTINCNEFLNLTLLTLPTRFSPSHLVIPRPLTSRSSPLQQDNTKMSETKDVEPEAPKTSPGIPPAVSTEDSRPGGVHIDASDDASEDFAARLKENMEDCSLRLAQNNLANERHFANMRVEEWRRVKGSSSKESTTRSAFTETEKKLIDFIYLAYNLKEDDKLVKMFLEKIC